MGVTIIERELSVQNKKLIEVMGSAVPLQTKPSSADWLQTACKTFSKQRITAMKVSQCG